MITKDNVLMFNEILPTRTISSVWEHWREYAYWYWDIREQGLVDCGFIYEKIELNLNKRGWRSELFYVSNKEENVHYWIKNDVNKRIPITVVKFLFKTRAFIRLLKTSTWSGVYNGHANRGRLLAGSFFDNPKSSLSKAAKYHSTLELGESLNHHF